MIKNIIFDMDGVLINTEPIHFRIWQQISSEHGVTLEYERYIACIGSTVKYLHDLLKEWYGLSFHNNPEIMHTTSCSEMEHIMMNEPMTVTRLVMTCTTSVAIHVVTTSMS